MENFDKPHILRLVGELRPSPLHHFRFELIPEVGQNKTAGRGAAGFAHIQAHSEAKNHHFNLAQRDVVPAVLWFTYRGRNGRPGESCGRRRNGRNSRGV